MLKIIISTRISHFAYYFMPNEKYILRKQDKSSYNTKIKSWGVIQSPQHSKPRTHKSQSPWRSSQAFCKSDASRTIPNTIRNKSEGYAKKNRQETPRYIKLRRFL